MDSILRQKIIVKLTNYLNRPPTEAEIINGQTDTNIIGWINKDDQDAIKSKQDSLSSKVDDITIKTQNIK